MTCVSILPEPAENGVTFRAIAGKLQSVGRTAGEALDALNDQLPAAESGTIVVVQSLRADRFFSAAQQRRLSELMSEWRKARDEGSTIPPDVQRELDALADAELQGAANRAAALVQDLRR
jgi:hypothetical protein